MITPEDIRERARKLWRTGRPMVSLLPGAEPLFPYLVPFRKPTAREWLNEFAKLRSAAETLERESKNVRGIGYSIEFREVAHQKLGMQRIPERIVFESAEDVAALADERAALGRFRTLAALVESHEPQLLTWLRDRPFAALDCDPNFPTMLAVATRFQSQPRPDCFARELGIPGVDGKFIETHRGVLAEWLDVLLPPDAIDTSVRGLSDRGFERRYGLRYEEPSIRFRWLDPSREVASGIRDASVPLSQLATYAPECERVIIAENKVNFLTFPPCADALAIFGSGYAIDLLSEVKWLGQRTLHYWGDLDTHGFAILSHLRTHWPHTQSFLMDHDTLLAHRELWTQEIAQNRCLRDLPGLTTHEQAVYDDLRNDRLGERVRLEQEKILFPAVETAVKSLNESQPFA